MLARFSVAPLNKWDGMSAEVAESLVIIKASGLSYQLTAMGTIVEGEPEEVFELIKKVHVNMRNKHPRVSTSIDIDDKVGQSGQLKAKTSSVESKLTTDG